MSDKEAAVDLALELAELQKLEALATATELAELGGRRADLLGYVRERTQPFLARVQTARVDRFLLGLHGQTGVAYPPRHEQRRVIKAMLAERAGTRGMLLAHGMGAGKTNTSLYVARELLRHGAVQRVFVLFPPASEDNFYKSLVETGWHAAGALPTGDAGAMERLRRTVPNMMTHGRFFDRLALADFAPPHAAAREADLFDDALVIIDEAHLVSEARHGRLMKMRPARLLLLSGTPAPNGPKELVRLIQLLRRDEDAPRGRWPLRDFNAYMALHRRQVMSAFRLDDANFFAKRGAGMIAADDAEGFPAYSIELCVCVVSDREAQLINAVVDSAPPRTAEEVEAALMREADAVDGEGGGGGGNNSLYSHERRIINVHEVARPVGRSARQAARAPPPSSAAAEALRGGRCVCPTGSGGGAGAPPLAGCTMKVSCVARYVRGVYSSTDIGRVRTDTDGFRTGGRVVVYVGLVQAREQLVQALAQLGIAGPAWIGQYHGAMSVTKKTEVRQGFDDGAFPIFIVSDAGQYGLDLKCVDHMVLGEVHWNVSKMNQIIGRGIRRGSHSRCQHPVKVKIFLATMQEYDRNGELVRVSGLPPDARRCTYDERLLHMAIGKDRDMGKMLRMLAS
jgi:hypothetical protein